MNWFLHEIARNCGFILHRRKPWRTKNTDFRLFRTIITSAEKKAQGDKIKKEKTPTI
ncbi:conserved hypothetical protein [delta proteobacterium NaphS2]|nr:conserved hypothetical protein [delta proteobacterium NaphS2]